MGECLCQILDIHIGTRVLIIFFCVCVSEPERLLEGGYGVDGEVGGWTVTQRAAVTASSSSSPLVPIWIMALLVVASIAITIALIFTVMYCLRRGNNKQQQQQPEEKPSNGIKRHSIEFVLPQTPLTYTTEPQMELPPVFTDIEEESAQHEPPPTPRPKRDRVSTTSASSLSTSSACSSPTRRKSSSNRHCSVQLEELDLSMYGDARDDELRGVTTICSRGRMCFSVVHDPQNECVIVNILRAHGLMSAVHPPTSTGRLHIAKQKRPRRMDTCVKLLFLGDNNQGYVTKTVRDSCDPVYEDSFCFHYSRYDQNCQVLIKLWVQEVDRFSRKTDIGIVTFYMRDLDDQASHGDVMEVWRDIVIEKQVI